MRTTSSLVASAILVIVALGCDSDTSVGTTDTAADDQALVLSVMSARGDTLTAAVEEPPADPNSADVVIRQSPQRRIQAVPAPVPAAAVVTLPPPSASQPRQSATPAPTISVTQVAEQPAAKRESREADVDRPEPAPKRRIAARTGIISSGSPLAVFTNQKVCGRTFRAVVSHTVRGTNGVVIPAGAQASGEVMSVDKWGAGIGVRVTSVRFDGNSYPVSSRTSYVLPQSDGCIPEQARIDVETKESLRVEAIN